MIVFIRTVTCSCLSHQLQLQKALGNPSGWLDRKLGQSLRYRSKGWTNIKLGEQKKQKTQKEQKREKEQKTDFQQLHSLEVGGVPGK